MPIIEICWRDVESFHRLSLIFDNVSAYPKIDIDYKDGRSIRETLPLDMLLNFSETIKIYRNT